MSDTEQEPSMEEILASIRRIISDDDKEMEAATQENEEVPRLKTSWWKKRWGQW